MARVYGRITAMSQQRHDAQRLRELQALPLERKIGITAARITEWYQHWDGKAYVSFSGGKDSTVLLHIARKLFPDIEAAFVDTGLEYPEIRGFVKDYDNVTWLKPEMRFDEVVKKYGYPVISKEVSQSIYEARKPNCLYAKQKFDPDSDYIKKYGMRYCLAKWNYLKDSDIPVSHLCCNEIKKKPLKVYERKFKNHPMVATTADESALRKSEWLKTGCNSFDGKRPMGKPMSFWTEHDILAYIKYFGLHISKVYGDIVEINGEYHTTGEKRTGCMFCAFGCHLEKAPNKFQRMAITHPKQYDYCMRPVEEKGLGLAAILDYIGVDYKPVIDNQIHMDIKI